METGLTRWRYRWEGAGIPTIPLYPGRKEPVCAAWQLQSSADQWAQVGGAQFRGNIGVVMGNGFAAIDCDAAQTITAATAGLAGMGIDVKHLPGVQTPSGGLHLYIRTAGTPEGAYCKLSPEVGPGELRYGPGAYLAAPCSEVDGRRYRFVVLYPEAIPALPVIRWRDLAWLVAPTAGPGLAQALEAPPVPLLRRAIPRRAAMLLKHLASTEVEKGKPVVTLNVHDMSVKTYASRSEAETAVVATLILAGWSLEEIRSQFDVILPGHYRDNPDRARCLKREYTHALAVLAASENRAALAEAYRNAQGAAWPGRGGLLERAVFLGLLAIGWQFDTWEVHASTRCLAEAAAASKQGVHNALARLRKRGLVALTRGWHADFETGELVALAHLWRVESGCTISRHKSHLGESMGGGTVGDGSSSSSSSSGGGGAAVAAVGAELWAAVGRSAGAVYGHLSGEPLAVKDLAALTGKHRNTVARALARLAAWDLAECTAGGWVRGAGDLGDVAQDVDAEGRAHRRRATHDREREAWYSHLHIGR